MALKFQTTNKPFGANTISGGTVNPLFQQLQPYSSFDLSKVQVIPSSDRNAAAQVRYGIPEQVNTGRGTATQFKDVTAYVNQLQDYQKTLGQKDSQGRSFYGTEGQLMSSPNRNLFDPKLVSDSRMTNPFAATGNNTALQARAAQFAKDNPGYFQVGEDPANRGNYNRGVLDTNNIATDAQVNAAVKYDPMYGYIAPNQYYKQARPDFLNKYGQYIPLLMFGAGVAASGIAGAGAASGAGGTAGTTGAGAAGAGTGAATTGGTFSGIGAGSTTGSLGLTGAGSTGLATGSTLAGGTGIAGGISTAGSAAAAGFGIPAAGYVGAGVGAGGALTNLGTMGAPAGATGSGGSLSSNYGTGAGGLGNSSGGSQGLFSSGQAAPITDGVPTSVGNGAPAGSFGKESAGLLGDLFKPGGSGGSVLSAIRQSGALGGGGSAGGGSGGSGGGGGGSIAPHDVTWQRWASPTNYLQALTNQAQPAGAAFGQYGDYNPMGGTPAKSYDELARQRAEYNQAMNGYLARQRAQLGF